MADSGSGLQIIDVSNPVAPVLLGSLDTPGDAREVAISGTTAYVADAAAGLQVISRGLGYSWEVSDSAATRPDAVIDGLGPVAFSGLADGTHYFNVRAVSGTTAYQTQTYQFRIDTEAPVTTPRGAVDSVGTATISLVATDTASGVASTHFILDGGSVATYTAPFAVSTPGTRTLEFYSVDNAGHREATKTVTFTITRSFAEVAGLTRYDTAVAASKRAFPTGADTVVIASGENWPDALGGTALAGAVDGPMLLVRPNALPSEVAAEIRRLDPSKTYILGGTGAVSAGVASAVEAIVGVGDVVRLAGPTRFETNSKIVSETISVLGPAYDGTAFVATGESFPYALSAAPLAAAKGWPIFLARPASIDSAAMAALGVTDVVILGGTGAIPQTVRNQVEAKLK
ncbi:MAG: cell wall-binding repeat-containing protein [Actinobacteria bacterium]|nr:cell wall-binding repeat-containing protein [Actinomycetota bacterium]